MVESICPGSLIWPVCDARSALELSAGVVQSSQTQIGDVIEFVNEGRERAQPDPQTVGATSA